MFAPTARDIVPFLDFGEECRDIFGLMLQIAVKRNDDIALSFVETRRQCRGLAEIAAQPYDLQPSVGLRQIRQQVEAPVGWASSMKRISYGFCRVSSTRVSRSYKGSSAGSSLWIGMTTESM
jgi:hypothetical protein